MAKMPQSDRLQSPEGRATYAFVFKPRAERDAKKEPRYSLCLLIPKDSPGLAEFKRAAQQCGIEAFGANYVEMVRAGRMKWPFRDGDVEPDVGPEYKGHTFLNMRNTIKPTILDRSLQEILDPAHFGSGDYCRVTGRFFAFDKEGNKGVAFSLGNIQKIRSGERLDNQVDARKEFDALDPEPASTSGSAAASDFDL